MARNPHGPQPPDTPDSAFTGPGATGKQDALSLIFVQLHELNGDQARIAVKTDRLISDVGELGREVRKLGDSLTLYKGFVLASVVLIPMCAALIWWLVGSRLNDIRDQIYQNRAVHSSLASSGAKVSA